MAYDPDVPSFQIPKSGVIILETLKRINKRIFKRPDFDRFVFTHVVLSLLCVVVIDVTD